MSKQASAAAKLELVWRDRLARQGASGQTVETFCRNEGVSTWSLYRWRKMLGASACPVGAVKAKEPAGFVDLGSIQSVQVPPALEAYRSPTEGATGLEIRIDLGSAAVLTITRR